MRDAEPDNPPPLDVGAAQGRQLVVGGRPTRVPWAEADCRRALAKRAQQTKTWCDSAG